MDAVNNEFAMAHWYIEQINAIAKAAAAYDEIGTEVALTLRALIGTIEMITKTLDDEITKGEERILAIKQKDDLTEAGADK